MERRSPYERVEIGFRQLKETVVGKITVVGQDHVVIIDDTGHDWTTPTEAIAYVIRVGRKTGR